MSERLGELYAVNFTDKNLCGFRNLEAGNLGNTESALTDYFGIKCTVCDYGIADLFLFFR